MTLLANPLDRRLLQTAAQELGVGLSVLKRICRQIGLARWPFRTRQSLRGVIAKTQQYLVRRSLYMLLEFILQTLT